MVTVMSERPVLAMLCDILLRCYSTLLYLYAVVRAVEPVWRRSFTIPLSIPIRGREERSQHNPMELQAHTLTRRLQQQALVGRNDV